MTGSEPRRGRKPRLLSPIRSFEGVLRVVSAGADEVYCGVRMAELGEFELYRGTPCEVPSYDELGRIVQHAHDHDVDVILTVNQPFMVKDMERHMRKHINSCLTRDIDALLIGDIGILSIVRDMGLDIPLYASTFMASINDEAVDFMRKLGFNRVVLERHLTMPEISEIAQHSKIDVEVFVHGDGCSNVNVNCYLYHFTYPEMLRAQVMIDGIKGPCTLSFGVYDVNDREKKLGDAPVLDSFTYCSLCRLPELIQTGVAGLKIVGRCQNEDYQERTTRIYRESIDLIQSGQMEAFQEKLESLKRSLIPVPFSIHNLQEFFCEQKRCYYPPLFHAPYKLPLSWQAWTKHRFKVTVVQR